MLAGLVLPAACAPAEPTQPAPPPPPAAVDGALGVVRVPAGLPVLVLDGDDDPKSLGPIIEAAFRTALEDFGAVRRDLRVEVGTIVATDRSREAAR
jgi:hypothetical protein